MKRYRKFILSLSLLAQLYGCAFSDERTNSIEYITLYGNYWQGSEDLIIIGFDSNLNECYRKSYEFEEMPYHINKEENKIYLLGGKHLYYIDKNNKTISIQDNQYLTGPVEELVSLDNQLYYLSLASIDNNTVYSPGVHKSDGELIYTITAPVCSITSLDSLYVSESLMDGESKITKLSPDGKIISTHLVEYNILKLFNINNKLIGQSDVGYVDIMNESLIGKTISNQFFTFQYVDNSIIRVENHQIYIDVFNDKSYISTQIKLPEDYTKVNHLTVIDDTVYLLLANEHNTSFFYYDKTNLKLNVLGIPDLRTNLKKELIGLTKI